MKLILLSGPSKCGKTTTFNKLQEKLISELGGTKLHYEQINNSKDFQSVIKINDKQIAVFSMGDLKNECIKAILKYLGVDILILAYNNHFAVGLFEEVPLKLVYTEVTGAEPPAHVIVDMEKKETDEEKTIEEERMLSEIIAELKKSL